MRTAPTAIIAIALLPLVLSADGGGDVSGSIEIDVRCEPDAHRIEGTAVLTLRDLGAGEPVFELHPGLTVEGVDIDGASVPLSIVLAMNLCLSLLPWARFRTTNACIKLHTLMDLRGSIPDDQRDERLAFLTNQFTLPAKTIAADGSNQFNSHIGRF